MNILLTGANGFIGRYLLADLVAAGHSVIPAVRRPAEADRLLPVPASIEVDFNRDTAAEIWRPRLAGIDVVINCAGILQDRSGQSIGAIHSAAPIALFTACRNAGVRRVIQISAISAEKGAGTAYAATKRAADEYLANTDLDWVILRPSLVYAEGAYGGTALLRALSALPGAVPVPGKGDQLFQPIHIDDLAVAVRRVVETASIRRVVIDPVGPDQLTLREILLDLRQWLGLPAAPVIPIPLALARFVARIGDYIGGPLNSTALRQLLFGNAGPLEPFVRATGITPRRWKAALLARPAQVQDRWHARLFFIRPLLRWALAAMWIVSGLVGSTLPAAASAPLTAIPGLTNTGAQTVAAAASIADMIIGLAVLVRWRPKTMTVVQIAVIAAYTIGLTIIQPGLWFDPFGPLLKNLPILAAVLALGAIETDR